jgi:hypothetical protein
VTLTCAFAGRSAVHKRRTISKEIRCLMIGGENTAPPF